MGKMGKRKAPRAVPMRQGAGKSHRSRTTPIGTNFRRLHLSLLSVEWIRGSRKADASTLHARSPNRRRQITERLFRSSYYFARDADGGRRHVDTIFHH
ncbi:putative transcriptional regulator [Anopheles sinensis]|uniref:Putative transcriptional regulator n=1 Tax=Anopheles sinensis TaxID=74873 RepID=A0A084VGB8_ANOSI|nr:putative transcriptional regulator [Anopheles sinensis]